MPSRFFAGVTLLLLAGSSRAERPPGAYDKFRAEANDAVTIRVVSVTSVVNGREKDFTVEAKVLGVERSNSGLKKGDTVTITYSVPTGLIPGPTPVPPLEKDGVYPAFLKKREKGYGPAAFGYSFKMTPEAAYDK